jgi:asparagine synthase (glutamine-hydrolysing)
MVLPAPTQYHDCLFAPGEKMTTIFGHPPLFGQTDLDGAKENDYDKFRAVLSAQRGPLALGLVGRPRLDEKTFDASTIAARLLAAYAHDDAQFLSRLRGSFALYLCDRDARTTLIAIDRMGIESLAWAASAGTLTFGSSAAEVARVAASNQRIDHQAIFDFMLGHVVASPDTAFVGVHKLLPATYAKTASGRVEVRRYWAPSFDRTHVDIATLQAAVLPTISSAVAATQPEPYESTGSFLSGGLDSSTVTGSLTKLSDRRSPAFSVGFGVELFDELAFARLAVQRFGCPHYEYTVTPEDIIELVPKIAAAYDEPFGNSSAVPTYCCARLAKSHGIQHLLAGDGGDEIFGGNERYVRHKIFEHYRKVPVWIRSGVLEPLAARIDPERAPLPLRKFSSYVRQAGVPLPERYETWNLVYREGPTNVFDSDFLASVDAAHPLRRMRETWEDCPSDDLLDRMLWYDWKYTLADNDLRKVTLMCDLAGVRVSYPMIDEDVVDLSIQVPTAAKISGHELRSFFKNAVRDFLPSEIIHKTKHGFGLPFGVWLKTHAGLKELVYDSLSTLKGRRLLDARFIERVIVEHRDGHASYYGSAIWDMLMLEQWLAVRDAEASAPSAVA